jgi:hypothetical protein
MAVRSGIITRRERAILDNFATKTICLSCVFISFYGLYNSSFIPTEPVSEPLKYLMIATLCPVVAVSVYVFLFSSFLSVKYSRDLRAIEAYVRKLAARPLPMKE